MEIQTNKEGCWQKRNNHIIHVSRISKKLYSPFWMIEEKMYAICNAHIKRLSTILRELRTSLSSLLWSTSLVEKYAGMCYIIIPACIFFHSGSGALRGSKTKKALLLENTRKS